MRCNFACLALVSVLAVSLFADEKAGDTKKEPRKAPSTQELGEWMLQLGARVTELTDAVQRLQDAQPSQAAIPVGPPQQTGFPVFLPHPEGSPPVYHLPSVTPTTSPNVHPSPSNADRKRQSAAAFSSQTAWRPEDAPRATQPSVKPRVAQESGNWQRFEIDGKVFYIVPAADVLQNESNTRPPARY